ncbi:MAG: ABC transporter transmembrane domain-containing protein [Oscillospiraceae bacterium]|nr:ABC transporter transmembrane domain-containing protein [Oscillospiraceae bacterium]
MLCEIRGLFKITGKGTRFIVLLILRCPFDAVLTFIQASFLSACFEAVNSQNEDRLYFACLLFAFECFALFLYNSSVWTIFAVNVTKWVGTLRKKLFGHISSGLSLQIIESESSGEWFTRLNYAVYSATAILTQPLHLPHAAVGLVNICVSSVMLAHMSPAIFGLVILFAVPHMVISQFILWPLPKFWRESLGYSAQNATDFNAVVTCADTAILYDAQGFLMKRFEESSLNIRKTNMKLRRRHAINGGVMPTLGMGGYLVILLLGSYWINAKTTTFGELTAAFQYRNGIVAGFGMLIAGILQVKSSLPGMNTINEIMNMQKEE